MDLQLLFHQKNEDHPGREGEDIGINVNYIDTQKYFNQFICQYFH